MSTTLTNGLKLPDKGSVDWYTDMQNNYTILDGAVGTIAEHTSALAGKAPLVHTHNKADITDLFNSANTWSSLNTYSNGQIQIKSLSQEVGVTPANNAIQYLEFTDKNNEQHGVIGLWDYTTGATEVQMYVADKYKNGAKDSTGTKQSTVLSFGFKADGTKFLLFDGYVDNSLYPIANNTYNLGDNSYQWNNVYAKGYYYNGVAWGLDKANVWSDNQNFRKTLIIQNSVAVSAGSYDIGINFLDSTGNRYGYIQPYVTTSNQKRLMFGSDTGELCCNSDLIPANNNLNFGNSTLKWKSFNGINPGALSLPNNPGGSGTVNVNYYDLSSIVTIRDGSGVNSYQPVCDGWIAINSFATWIQIANDTTLVCVTGAIGADGFGQCYLPVRKNDNIRIVINQTNTNFQSFKLIPCQGNV